MKLLIAGGAVALFVVVRTSRWRQRLAGHSLTGKVAAIALAVGWVAAVIGVLLFL